MEASISYITLGVRDLPRATIFYRDTLELPILPSSNEQVSFFQMGAIRLALYPRQQLAVAAGLDVADTDPATGFSGFSLSHNVSQQPEVDALLKHVAAHGGRILQPGHSTEWGGYAGYFCDPEGFLWEVAWNPKHARSAGLH